MSRIGRILKRIRDKRVRIKRRKKGRDRQLRKHRKTGKKGYLKQAQKRIGQIRHLRGLLQKEKSRLTAEQARLEREDTWASENFRYREFDTHDGTPVPLDAYPALRHLCENYLEPLRAKFGPVSITSGYRHAAYNYRIGGASASYHIYDYPGRRFLACAADVTCAKGTPAEWGAFLETLNPGGLGIYRASGFVHVDNRQLAGSPRSRGFGN